MSASEAQVRRPRLGPLRVAHLSSATGPHAAGIQAAVDGIARSQARNKTLKVTEVGIVPIGWQWDGTPAAGVARVPIRSWPPRIFSYVPSLASQLRTLSPNILHQHGLWQHAGIVATRLAAPDLALVVSPHGMLAARALRHRSGRKRLAWWLYQRKGLTAVDLFHVTSEAELADVRAAGMRQPIAMIPFGVHVPETFPHHAKRVTHTALFLSRIHPIKGVLDLVHAWSQVHPDGWRLIIAGPDECGHAAEVEESVRKHGLAGQVTIEPPRWGVDRDRLIDECDLFVLPSHSENFGIAVAEALARGVPVLTTKGTPWHTLQSHGCGWWVPVGTEGLAAGLREACHLDRDSLRTMGMLGWKMVKQQYGWELAAERFAAVYAWLLGRGSQPDCISV